MKLFTILALVAAFTSPAIAEVVSSKQPGKAHCAKNEADQELVKKAIAANTGDGVSNSGAAR